ncbi:hypothetical protein Tco_0642400 [Tanacetum coccineum]
MDTSISIRLRDMSQILLIQKEPMKDQVIKLNRCKKIIGEVVGRRAAGSFWAGVGGTTAPVLDPSQFLDPEEDATGDDQDDATDLGGE